jgi:N-acyl homoserine lactone hydrolase
MMRIHAIKTGTFHVKRHYYAAEGRTRIARLTSALLDNQFKEIPVYTWAIEHPEGLIVIDTGLSARLRDPNYYPLWLRPYALTQYRFNIEILDEIGPQLRTRGIPPEDVRWVILTHSHFDHTSALYHFTNAEFVISRKEWEDTQNYRSAHFAFPSKWPSWMQMQLIDFEREPLGAFDRSFGLTRAGDVRLVPTPGHTMGHMSVVLEADDVRYFFGGDTSFDLKSLQQGILDAPSFNSHVTLHTRRKILDTAADMPLVYLTTHDEDTERRLHARTPLYANIPAARVGVY